jgi:hypothetical protein
MHVFHYWMKYEIHPLSVTTSPSLLSLPRLRARSSVLSLTRARALALSLSLVLARSFSLSFFFLLPCCTFVQPDHV